MSRLNVLFVCSKNQWRSPTAEKVYAGDLRLNVRSRGTANSARQTIGPADIDWADVIMVMEQKHKQRLLADFLGPMRFQEIHVLDIPDDYQFMDSELVELIQSSVEAVLKNRPQSEPE